ncbi:MAG: division/cell wall cluster transcriptional repressor MraZ [Flavobacteriales bacterium]|nr:division/cell wall cluster transcriptional repressor MraZ [Flavobacteriales bacterium]
MLNLLGEYDCRLDAKGRVMLPAALKKQLGGEVPKGFVMNRDVFRPCLVLYPMIEWERTNQMLRRLNRFMEKNMEFIRRFTSGATPLELDGNGRLLLPYALMADARMGKDIKMVGLGDRIEVWSKEGYDRMRREKVDLTALAEEVMGSLGNEDGQ